MIAFSIALAFIAQPVPTPVVMTLPALVWKSAGEVEDEWRAVRKVSGDKKKLEAIKKAALDTWACKGLVEMQALADAGGLAWKDTVRGRSWTRPALARVLVEAHREWHETHSEAIAVGDVAQAGCGQIDPGVLTRLVTGDDAKELRDAAVPIFGIPTIRSDAPDLMSERRLMADDGTTLFTQTRRYRPLAEPDRGARFAFQRDVQAIVDAGEVALETRLDEADGRWYRQTIVDAKAGMQVVVVRKNRGKRFWLEDARDVRVGFWLPGRPGVFPGETRWIAKMLDDKPQWSAFELVVEGAHATHMAGRDADLSYPIADASKRFENVPADVDLAATWSWFETLVATGERLGTPIERIIVGPKMHARLLREIKDAKTHKLFADKIIRLVREHDDHHHIRISEPTPEADQQALDALTSR